MALEHVSSITDEILRRIQIIKSQYTGSCSEPPTCKECGDTGYIITRMPDSAPTCAFCRCRIERDNLQRIERSELKPVIDTLTFDAFEADKPWQRELKGDALRFLNDNHGKWFYAGGQVGCGKTHICTAIAGELLRRGKSVLYMRWVDDTGALKESMFAENSQSRFGEAVLRYKRTPVLYIDDFFKCRRDAHGKGSAPTPGEIRIAFEILNHRYSNPDLVTIISCEHSIDDLIGFDEAVGSRIYQRTRDYCTVIGKDISKNYRLNGAGT